MYHVPLDGRYTASRPSRRRRSHRIRGCLRSLPIGSWPLGGKLRAGQMYHVPLDGRYTVMSVPRVAVKVAGKRSERPARLN